MITPTKILVLALLSTASAQRLARRVPQDLPERSVRAKGGWALLAEDKKFCPNDLAICGTDTQCCPTSMTCQGFGGPSNLCCPGPESCVDTYKAAPYCADDTWSLWDATQGGINNSGYFCCAPGQVGLLDWKCVDPITITNPSLGALAVMPGGGLLSASAHSLVVATTSVIVTGVAVNSVATSVSTSTAVSVASAKSSGGVSVQTLSVIATTTSVVGATTAATGGVSGTSASSASSSAAASATKASGGNRLKGFGAGLLTLAGGALFAGVAL